MKLMIRFYSLLALLLMGSASLQAQGDDPFGSFNPRLYQGYMSITAQVQQNGAILTDALIAVYCEEELRGKSSVGNGTNPQLAYLSVYGNNTGTNQYLHFKVLAGGCIFTINPSPAIIYKYDGDIGTEAAPYVITLPVSLSDSGDNTDVLTTYKKDETCDVVLTGRTLYKDGNWNTLCLPFTLTASEVNEHLENPTGLMTLSSSSFDSATGTLTLNFSNELENGIVAGKPYIVKWTTGDDLVNPVFTGVTISDATANVSTDYVDFLGTYSPTLIYESGTEKHNLYLGTANTLYYPTTEGFQVNACRAYFQLKNDLTCGTSSNPVPGSGDVKAFNLNFGEEDATRLNEELKMKNEEFATAPWYDLNGRKLAGKPTQKGIYIHNGSKVLK